MLWLIRFTMDKYECHFLICWLVSFQALVSKEMLCLLAKCFTRFTKHAFLMELYLGLLVFKKAFTFNLVLLTFFTVSDYFLSIGTTLLSCQQRMYNLQVSERL